MAFPEYIHTARRAQLGPAGQRRVPVRHCAYLKGVPARARARRGRRRHLLARFHAAAAAARRRRHPRRSL